MNKIELAKLIKIKKNKIVALEMNIALHRNDVARYTIRKENLLDLIAILEENIAILSNPEIFSREGSRLKSEREVADTLKDIAKLDKKIAKAEAKANTVLENQRREMGELKVMEDELNAPADVLPFVRKNVG